MYESLQKVAGVHFFEATLDVGRYSSHVFGQTLQREAHLMSYLYKTMDSPIGLLTLVASDKGLAGVLWEHDNPDRVKLTPRTEDTSNPILLETEKQLSEYFAGKRRSFSVTLDYVGTPFQKKVWKSMLAIPFGETRSYGQLAEEIGNPKAVRAVGAANGKNPISIIGPCHRVIGASGKLTGFAGGLKAKAYLLGLEADQANLFR
jgi:methylated-DNA-[protein]-cysteine S-methyltransferase